MFAAKEAHRYFRVTFRAGEDGRSVTKLGRLLTQRGESMFFAEVGKDGGDRESYKAKTDTLTLYRFLIVVGAEGTKLVPLRMNLKYGELEPVKEETTS